MELDPLRVRGARPVADAPVHALSAHSDRLAKGWLLAILERRPLEAMATAPTRKLATEGPALCSSTARALASDEELADLVADAPAALRGLEAGDATEIVEVFEALRAIVWAAIVEILPEPRPGQLADLADRLAHVVAELLRATLAPVASSERAPAAEPPGEPASLWDRALERKLDEGTRLGERTALILVEVDGVRRLRAAGELDGVLERGAAIIREEVRRGDPVAHEEDGRTWVLAVDAGRPAAEALARRIAARLAVEPGPRGASLTVSVGLAVHPDDGGDAGSLSAHAEEAMLAARAAGVRLIADLPR
ncbi:MAG: diguanylate cyclase domain-containing protein [Solirubrobacteraceae bacterium]